MLFKLSNYWFKIVLVAAIIYFGVDFGFWGNFLHNACDSHIKKIKAFARQSNKNVSKGKQEICSFEKYGQFYGLPAIFKKETFATLLLIELPDPLANPADPGQRISLLNIYPFLINEKKE